MPIFEVLKGDVHSLSLIILFHYSHIYLNSFYHSFIIARSQKDTRGTESGKDAHLVLITLTAHLYKNGSNPVDALLVSNLSSIK